MKHISMYEPHICPKCEKENIGSAEAILDLIICPKCAEQYVNEFLPKIEKLVRDYFKPEYSNLINNKWISVKDRLPENDDDVLGYWTRDGICISSYNEDEVHYYIESDGSKFFLDNGWDDNFAWARRGEIIYWMPLPSTDSILGINNEGWKINFE